MRLVLLLPRRLPPLVYRYVHEMEEFDDGEYDSVKASVGEVKDNIKILHTASFYTTCHLEDPDELEKRIQLQNQVQGV